MITFSVRDTTGEVRQIEVPEDINLNLMEVLKASDYPVAAICGGMALCATCRVAVLEGGDRLPAPQAAELDTLDTIPNACASSRLSCQIKINGQLNQALFELKGGE